MRMVFTLLICALCSQPSALAHGPVEKLPSLTRLMLDRRFPGWRLAEVSREVQEFFETKLKGAAPTVISGDFDGNHQLDYAALIRHGKVFNEQGKVVGAQYYLVVFLRRGAGYRMFVIKDPGGEYLSLSKKGTKAYNYNEQREITYANDAIEASIFEKAGSAYVYEKGKFRSFVSSD